MKIKAIVKTVAAVLATGLLSSSNANSVGFEQEQYLYQSEISVSLVYDFTDFAMFGGGLNIEYDTSALLFISYTQADLQPDAQAPASPEGSLTSPGLYSNAGIGTFEYINGMNSAGTLGTFTFEVLGDFDFNSTSCGKTLCIVPYDFNPFVSLAGLDVTDELIDNGISGAFLLQPVPIPVPTAAWLMLSGLIGLTGLGRRST